MVALGTILQHRYQVLQPLGKGSSSLALLAKDLLHDDLVTLKILQNNDPSLLNVLQQEFAVLVGRYHPHLPLVRDLESFPENNQNHFFYTADFIDGSPLSKWAQHRSHQDILPALAHTLEALQFLHRLGIRHGDIKPDNILVTPEGQGVLIDLGCAQPLNRNLDVVSGTPPFMAPELLRGDTADVRADLYSFGVTCSSVLKQPYPPNLVNLIRRLTADRPDDRPSDVAEVQEALGLPRLALGPPRGRLDRIVGQHPLLRAFHDAIEALYLQNPHARCLALHGPDGSGRTRLLRKMKWEAQLRGSVVEGWAHAARPIETLLLRACGTEKLSPGVCGLLEARQTLARRPTPLVLILDDTHELDTKQQELLDTWIRLLEPTDPWLILLAGRNPPSTPSPGFQCFEIPPLNEQAIADWTQGLLGPKASPHILRLTGGYPSDVEALVDKIVQGTLAESDLPYAGPEILPSSIDQVSRLSDETKLVLGWLAVDPLDEPTLRSCCAIDSSVLSTLEREGWIRRDGSRWRLQRASTAPQVLQVLDPVSLTAIHRWHAQVPMLNEADRAFHLAKAGDGEQAQTLLLEAGFSIDEEPGKWRRVVDALEDASLSSEGYLECARIDRLNGRLDRALSWIARVLRLRPDHRIRVACRREAAACYLAAGRLGRAKIAIRKGRGDAKESEDLASLIEVGCRISIHLGDYDGVVQEGSKGLDLAPSNQLRSMIHEIMGVACTYLGRIEEGDRHLQQAEAQRSRVTPREQVRILSYRAILAYRQGNLPRAIEGYQQALRWAEDHGLADYMATTAMNLGTAQQQQGEWGKAIESYERGLQISRAIGKENTARTLRLNLANLYTSVGLFDRARSMLATLKESQDLGYVEANTTALEAELLLAEGFSTRAEEGFLQASRLFHQQGALREVSEMQLHCASLALSESSLQKAEEILNQAVPDPDESPVDLLARWHALRARWCLQTQPTKALSEAKKALEAAGVSKQPALEAEMQALIADVYDFQAATQLAQDHRRAARRTWESIAVGLPETLRPAFWKHPLRTNLTPSQNTLPTVATAPDHRSLVRILEINRRMNSSRAVDGVLSCALDAAIELSEAERGFLLIRSEGGSQPLEVAVARNLDRERIGRSHLKFSRGIAEKVIRTGQPISTTDALADNRFRSNQSVHAMRLRSVVCVPVIAPQGVLGAIYLDHRFRKDQFNDTVIELLLAFADQVAIALCNARLVTDLERKTRALQAEQDRVQALLQGQAAEIDRLSSEVRTRQEALEYRYDYSSIVGNSAPMQAVFRILDRVTDTSIDVLVQGESGTGKELVARALHFNGPRRRGPFLSINCAALPEALLESELFGVVRGAFTGADRDREGLIASARGGTLFLDEVGEMPLSMQSKLLRVLQERKVRPIGSNKEESVDIRLVSATNRRLIEEVDAGRFRQDLYYRIAVVEIRLPALRERREDIPVLCSHFLSRAAMEMGCKPVPLRSDALRALMQHPLPGNVRQLDNILRRALALSEGQAMGVMDLDLIPAAPPQRKPSPKDRDAFEQEESARILSCLKDHRWNVSAVARSLGIPRNTLYRKLRKYRIEKP